MKTRFKSLIALLLAVGSTTPFFTACDKDDDDDLTLDESYNELLKEYYPAAKDVEWEKKGVYDVADFQMNGIDYDIWFDASGNIVMHELDYGEDILSIPNKDVLSSFQNGDYGTWTVEDVTYYKQERNYPTSEFYVIEVELANHPDMDLYYNNSGDLIKAIKDDISEVTPETIVG